MSVLQMGKLRHRKVDELPEVSRLVWGRERIHLVLDPTHLTTADGKIKDTRWGGGGPFRKRTKDPFKHNWDYVPSPCSDLQELPFSKSRFH